MEQLSVEDWKPDACPKNITVYHAAMYLAETTQKVHSSQDWYLYLNEKVDQSGEVLIGEYDVSETDKTEET